MLSFSDQEKSLEPVIRLENVSVRYRAPEERIGTFKEYAIRFLKRQIQYKEFKALNDVSLEVRKGEILGVVGRNGAGKSTLLKVISRVLIPKTGRVWIRGRVAPLLELGAGFHPELTGRENVFVNGTLLGHSHAEIEKQLASILEFAELAEFIDAPLRTYSSGMVARLGFAVATAWIPEILIVDEVLGVGDYAFQQKCQARMEEFRNHGTTILLVTHDTNAVRRLCDRVVWLERGVVKGIGQTADVIETYMYASTFSNWLSFAAGHAPEAQAERADQAIGAASDSLVPALEIQVGGKKRDSYQIPEHAMLIHDYPDSDGLVSVVNTKKIPLCVARHLLYKNSFSEVMGVSPARFSTRYWFPLYDAQSMQATIVISNPDKVHVANVDVFLALEKRGSYQIAASGYLQVQFPGLMGPVSVVSTNNVPFFASQQVLYGDSFSEIHGIAHHELAGEVWFPWYNSQTVRSWVVAANPDSATPIDIKVWLGHNLQGEYQIPAGGFVNLQYADVVSGPLRISSMDGRSILATQRVIRSNSFAENPGLTLARIATEYWFPWHDYQSMVTRIFLTNPDLQRFAEVVVQVGGNKYGPYQVLADATLPLDCQNVLGGPLCITSVNGVPIFAAQRFVYGNSLTDITGLPASEFFSEYWFSPYNLKSARAWLVLSDVSQKS